jgi:hypothetical protein
MPASLSPMHNLSGDRMIKKQQQCESFARALNSLLPRSSQRRLVVVDFGSGSGSITSIWFLFIRLLWTIFRKCVAALGLVVSKRLCKSLRCISFCLTNML